MSKVFSNFPIVINGIPTSKSIPASVINLSVERVSTDAYFYADVTIHNAVVGSRYWLVNNDDYSQVLATGIISSNPEVLSGIPSYGSPMLILLRLRNASGAIKYKQYESVIPHSKSGSSFYCAQVED